MAKKNIKNIKRKMRAVSDGISWSMFDLVYHEATALLGKMDTLKDTLFQNRDGDLVTLDIMGDVLSIYLKRFDKIWEAASQGKELEPADLH
jgi:hypothetical protein